MTSHSRRDRERPMFTTEAPHFFKVILDQTIRDGKIEIPKRFVRKYGKPLPSLVHLEVPSGEIWQVQVQLTKCDQRVWLQNGWQEFAENYSLKFGHFVVFRYEGNALFHVLIFDRTASEIEYPCRGTDDDEDDSLECTKRKEKSDAPCLQPQKKRKVDTPNETGINVKSRNLAPSRKGKEVIGQKSSQIKVTKWARRLSADEKIKTLKKAGGFRTKNPFFMVVMQPTHIIHAMGIPVSFARKHLQNPRGRDVILSISDGKTWRGMFCCNPNGDKLPQLRGANWKAFAQHNALGIGDVCVFELTERSPEIMFKVVIYRAGEDANAARSQEEADESIENLEDIAPCKKTSERSPLQCPRPPKLRTSSSSSKGGDAPEFPKRHSCSSLQPPEAAASKRASNIPLFRKVIKPSLVDSGGNMKIPFEFIEKHFKPDAENVFLQVADRVWATKLMVYKHHRIGQLSAGWTKFAMDNSLKVGDVCVFKMITASDDDMMFDVIISRRDG